MMTPRRPPPPKIPSPVWADPVRAQRAWAMEQAMAFPWRQTGKPVDESEVWALGETLLTFVHATETT